jgi:hypothetical protein
MASDGAENAARRRDDFSHNWMEVIFLSRGQKDWRFAMLEDGDPAFPSVGTLEESDLRRPRLRGALSEYCNISTHLILFTRTIADLAGTASLALLSN